MVKSDFVVFHISKTPVNSSDRVVLLNVVNNTTFKLESYGKEYGSTSNCKTWLRLVGAELQIKRGK